MNAQLTPILTFNSSRPQKLMNWHQASQSPRAALLNWNQVSRPTADVFFFLLKLEESQVVAADSLRWRSVEGMCARLRGR